MSKRTKIVHMMDKEEKAAGVTRCGLLRKKVTTCNDDYLLVTCTDCLKMMVIAAARNHIKEIDDKNNAIEELKKTLRYKEADLKEAEQRFITAEDVNKRSFERAMKLLAERNALLQALVHATNKADHGALAEPFLD